MKHIIILHINLVSIIVRLKVEETLTFLMWEHQSNMMSFKASFACFLLLFLGFIFSSSASRDSTWMKSGIVVQETHIQHEIDMTGHGESMESDGPTTRRMDLESMDYGGPGANERHNPPSPGGL